MYRVKVLKKVEKKLQKLPKADAKRIWKKIQSLKDFDSVKCSKIHGEYDVFRVRVGNYRILFIVDFSIKTVFVIKVDKREKIYKNL